jgi:MoxR-like ATPase
MAATAIFATRKRLIPIDGIDPNGKKDSFVERLELVNEIIATADLNQHVVLSSPPATGKTSLLDLVTTFLSSLPNQGPVLVLAPGPQTTGSARIILDELNESDDG